MKQTELKRATDFLEEAKDTTAKEGFKGLERALKESPTKIVLVLQVIVNIFQWAGAFLFVNGILKNIFPLTFRRVFRHLGLYVQIISVFGCLVRDIVDIVKMPASEVRLCTDKFAIKAQAERIKQKIYE